MPKFLLIGSLFFFAVAAGFAFITFRSGHNVVSSENLSIAIAGPVSVKGGEVAPIEIIITNENPTALRAANLQVSYPEGTRRGDAPSKDLLRSQELIGDIESGASVRRSVTPILVGEEGSLKEINVALEYRLEGSSALFFKEKKFDVLISDSPISLNVDMPSEATVNREFPIEVSVSSNSSSLVRGVVLRAEYGFGYRFVKSEPKTATGDNVWRLGDLRPGESRSLTITGLLQGQEGEERVFRFFIGAESETNQNEIGVPILSDSKSLVIKQPFMSADLTLNNRVGDVAVSSGEPIKGQLVISNNLPSRLTGVEVDLSISGLVLDKESVASSNGFYNSVDNVISWNRRNQSDLAVMNPGEELELSFGLKSLPVSSLVSAGLKNQELVFSVNIRANRISESRVPEEVSSLTTKKIKIASDVGLDSRAVRGDGPFPVTGPVPPRANQETIYTIVWTLTNTLNNVSNAEVRATLPQYVRFAGVSAPAEESLIANSQTGEVVWRVGEVAAHTGFALSPRQVVFQVGLTPSLSQVGSEPVLVGPASFSGVDRFTGGSIKDAATNLTTRFSADSNFKNGDENVVK